jgi:hypothetical protein
MKTGTRNIIVFIGVMVVIAAVAMNDLYRSDVRYGISMATRICPKDHGKDILLATSNVTNWTTDCHYAAIGASYGRAKKTRKAT